MINARTITGLIFAAALGVSLLQAGVFEQSVVNPGGWPLAWRFVRAALRPELSIELLPLAVQSTLVTLAYAICGTTLSLIIGAIGGILSSEVWWHSVLPNRAGRFRVAAALAPWLAVRALLAIPRAIHEAIWGVFFVNIIGLDPLTAVLAIAIPFGAITAKVFAEILDETPRTALHALQGSGVKPFAALMYSILPQSFPELLSYTFYRFECAIRSAALLGIIGAGGLGYQILLSLQSLRYQQMWTFLYALILLSGLTDVWSAWVRRGLNQATAREKVGRGERASHRTAPALSQPAAFPRVSLLIATLLIPFGFWYVNADVGKLTAPRTIHLLARIAADSFPPRLDSSLLVELLHLSGQTLSMSILAMTFAGIGGLVLSYPAARGFLQPGGMLSSQDDSHRFSIIGAALYATTRGILLVTRAIAEPIWAFIFLLVLFPGLLPGAFGLGLYNLGILGRLMAEVAEHVDRRPLQALEAQGASRPQIFAYGVLPATLRRNLAYVLYRWEVCMRATAVVGLVGAGGLGRTLSEQLASFDYRSVSTTLLFFIGLTFLVDLTSTTVRRMLR